MSPLGPKLSAENQDDRPILTVVPGREEEADTLELSTKENPRIAKLKAAVMVVLAVTLVLVTSHMTGPDPRGRAQNLLHSLPR